MRHAGRLGIGMMIAGLCVTPAGYAQYLDSQVPDQIPVGTDTKFLRLGTPQGKTAPTGVLDSSDLFWVPTMAQAAEMAKATGKPIFSMGYSLVPDGTTYTKKGDDCPKGVF